MAALSPVWISCVVVLDLDAEGGDGGQGGEGAGLSASTGGDPKGGSKSAGPGPGPGPDAADCEGHVVFSGQQYISISDGEALDMENDFGIVARVQSSASADGSSGEGAILSRLSLADQKGFSLVLVEPVDDGTVYPELRLYVAGELCVCTSSTPLPPGAWTTVAAGFAGGPGVDAEVWVDGNPVCAADCGDGKLSTFSSPAVIGAATDRTSGFLKGALSELTVRHWKDRAMLNGGCSGTGAAYLSLSFESALGQSFAADCPDLALTLGESSAAASDDPAVVSCP